MRRFVALLVVALPTILVTSCATRPDEITAAFVSSIPYDKLSCDELDREYHVAVSQRDTYIKKQKDNRKRDILLNALVLVGSGALTSDHEDEVANSKGKVDLLEVLIKKKCA